MLCRDIMKQRVECLSPLDTVQTAACKMRDSNIGFLPVCDAGGAVTGTLTDRDVAIRLVAENRSAAAPVADIMSNEVVCCHPDDDVIEAERLMSEKHKSRIVCIDDSGALVGVISLSDIVQHEKSGRAADTMRR